MKKDIIDESTLKERFQDVNDLLSQVEDEKVQAELQEQWHALLWYFAKEFDPDFIRQRINEAEVKQIIAILGALLFLFGLILAEPKVVFLPPIIITVMLLVFFEWERRIYRDRLEAHN